MPTSRQESPLDLCAIQPCDQHIWHQARCCWPHLKPFVRMLLSCLFCTVLLWTIIRWPWFHGEHRLCPADPRGHLWLSPGHQHLDKEDFAGGALYLLSNVWCWNCNNYHYWGLPKFLAMGWWKDIIFFKQNHLLALQGSGIASNSCGYACCLFDGVCT